MSTFGDQSDFDVKGESTWIASQSGYDWICVYVLINR